MAPRNAELKIGLVVVALGIVAGGFLAWGQAGAPYNAWATVTTGWGDCRQFLNQCTGNTMMIPNGNGTDWGTAVNSSPGCLAKQTADACTCFGQCGTDGSGSDDGDDDGGS